MDVKPSYSLAEIQRLVVQDNIDSTFIKTMYDVVRMDKKLYSLSDYKHIILTLETVYYGKD